MPEAKSNAPSQSGYKDKDKPTQIRYSNITAAKGVQTCQQTKTKCYVLIKDPQISCT